MHAAALFAAVNAAIFTTELHAIPVILATAFVLLALYGFRPRDRRAGSSAGLTRRR